jgi:uncharacterized membrane protein YgaE (UPF0421/DUF939 family)
MTTADLFALIAENDKLVDEITDLDLRIRGIMFTSKKNRRERYEQMRRQRAAKLRRHRELVAEIKKLSPLSRPV